MPFILLKKHKKPTPNLNFRRRFITHAQYSKPQISISAVHRYDAFYMLFEFNTHH